MIGCCDTVRGKEIDDLVWAETRVSHSGQYGIHRVAGFRDKEVRGCEGVVRTAGQEFKMGASGTVAYTNRTGELNAEFGQFLCYELRLHRLQVAKGYLMFDGEGPLGLDNVVDTVVCIYVSHVRLAVLAKGNTLAESRLDLCVCHKRAVWNYVRMWSMRYAMKDIPAPPPLLGRQKG